ncbi:mitochondrial import inner membrane translocase, subunit Tim17/22 [Corynespora cassiicola Philippines]|uniref:Mitochondrial import inner membrane translocase subunit TIM22 n=1 Tax=Corynespora cassiicola Philippines TaxID=1448308 RepID=A0A2T2P9X6_CORCC|nr:mitochondrial import inner membrane translocase, subunit Tim17/22 [Corynespora cassiicola Philippines]
MQGAMESCAGKTVMAGVMGGGLGAMFGLFMASVSTASVSSPFPSTNITDLPLRQQLKHGLRDMYRSSVSSGKNFAKVGAIFSGTECAIEGLRAKNDLWNGVAGGCITGGVLARNAGPQAVAVGCAGFAVFSAAIDAYMVSLFLSLSVREPYSRWSIEPRHTMPSYSRC